MCPKNWSGYIRIVVGFLILTVLLTPLLNLKNIEVLQLEDKATFEENALEDKVKKELEIKVEADICQRLQTEFNQKAEADVRIDTDEDGKIRGVRNIVVKLNKIPAGMVERLKEVYGCENIELKLK